MRTHQIECKVETNACLDFVDVTEEVQGVIEASGITEGQATIVSLENGCTLVTNEKETGLMSDIRAALDRLGAQDVHSRHALIGSTSVVLPVSEGELRLGTWQRVLLAELEHAGIRSIVIQVVGE
jgi:secondary thiamine-phosphate synthase enzyme